jgi:phospholipid/cholesterol/gamma-HCH transport system ATP-binding protein
VNLRVRRGEVFVIMGPSGCGKSTLLKLAIGLLRPDGGRLRLLGRDVATEGHRSLRDLYRRIGVLFQGGALFGSRNLEENVGAPLLEHTALPAGSIRMVARMKLASVGLLPFAGFHPSEISGGMRKRAAIARALALDPEVLFLDEPSAGLDPVTAGGLDDLIVHFRDHLGLTLFVVTHELPSIFRIADRILMLEGGRVIAEGTREDILYSEDRRVKDFLLRNSTAPEAAREGLIEAAERSP